MRIEAKTLEEAYVIAANKLNCSVTDLEIEIIQHPRRGIFGLFAILLFNSDLIADLNVL